MAEDDRDEDGSSQRSRIRVAQVAAAALAAVTAAFLGSSLGVYGTVLGAGLVSVLTTLGSELYLRSLERTREAAKRTRDAARARGTRQQATQVLEIPAEEAKPARGVGRKLRWGVIAGTSVLAFGIGMLVLTGFELGTGESVSGNNGSTIGRIVGGGGGASGAGHQPDNGDAPATAPETTTPAPTSEPTEPTETGEPSTTQPTRSTTTKPSPTTESEQPSQPRSSQTAPAPQQE